MASQKELWIITLLQKFTTLTHLKKNAVSVVNFSFFRFFLVFFTFIFLKVVAD